MSRTDAGIELDGCTRLTRELVGPTVASATKVFIVDDNDGTLTRTVAEVRPRDSVNHVPAQIIAWSDQLNHEIAVRSLCADLEHVTVVSPPALAPSSEAPIRPEQHGGAIAIVRLPKSHGALARICQQVIDAGCTKVFFVGRIKHMNRNQNQVLEQYFSQVNASLGKYKSRMLTASVPREPRPKVTTLWQHIESTVAGVDVQVWSAAGTYGWGKIDFGTTLLLQHVIPHLTALTDLRPLLLADLGCGDGLIAAALCKASPHVSVQASDTSSTAVQSTRRTICENQLDDRVRVSQQDALHLTLPGSLDYVVTNPPFHEGTTVDREMAQGLFKGAAAALRAGGELWCVYNSMLQYKSVLRRHVGPTSIVAQNQKFTVTRSLKLG